MSTSSPLITASRTIHALILGGLALACGSQPASTAGSIASTGGEAQARPLDWAMLLPIETDGLVRIDLARARRSPHSASLEPVLADLLSGMAEPALRGGLASLIERTNLVMIAMLPPELGRADDVLILARGTYHADEIERLESASDEPGRSRAIDVEGHRVWVGQDGEATSTTVTMLRPDTLAVTSSLERMERLIARTRMSGGRRWPPSLRELVEATSLEGSMLGLALANENVGVQQEGVVSMSVAGTVDADGPLDLEIVFELGDPTLAAAAAVFLQAMVQELVRSAGGESFAVGRLAELARVEALGTRVRGTIHADATAAEQLVPGLAGLVRDGLADEEPPALGQILPTPI